MNKIIRIFIINFCCFSIEAGIGAQFNIDQYAKPIINDQKIQIPEQEPASPSASPRSILRKKINYVSSQEDGWVLGLLKCLQT